MAGRCGCGGGTCNCVLEVEEPLTKEGGGSVVSPWKLGLDKDALFNDIAGNGLSWDENTDKLQACLSRDTGNGLRFGGDGCLWAPGGDTPMPDVCARPIDSLPAAPGVVGAKSLAGLLNPYSSPFGVDYCLAHGLDIIHFQVATSSDDVGVVSDYWDDRITDGRTSIYVAQDIRQMNAATCQSAYSYAGDVDDPVAYQRPNPQDTTTRGDRRGGWYGWLAQRYYQPLAEDFLRKINAKSVALLACTPEPGVGFGSEATHIRGAIRAILQQCAQPWAVIGVSSIANASTVLGAGITPVLGDTWPIPLDAWGVTELPFPVADVTGAGIEWMALSDHYADSVFSAYQAAGINVLMIGNSRQSQAARIASLGIRGALCMDPVYYKEFRDGYGYRSATDPWEHRRMGVGQLTFRTDQQDVISAGGYVRGRAEAGEQGLVLPGNFGDGVGRPSVLCGWECPMANPTAYTITWDMRWNTLATALPDTAKMGLLFGADTDTDPYAWPDNPTLNPKGYPEGQRTLYRVYQRQTGEIGLAKWASATGNYTVLATADTPAVAADVWNSYELVVTDTQITFTRQLTDGTRFTVTAADTEYRGGYFWIEKEEAIFGDPPNPFEGKFRNIAYTPA